MLINLPDVTLRAIGVAEVRTSRSGSGLALPPNSVSGLWQSALLILSTRRKYGFGKVTVPGPIRKCCCLININAWLLVRPPLEIWTRSNYAQMSALSSISCAILHKLFKVSKSVTAFANALCAAEWIKGQSAQYGAGPRCKPSSVLAFPSTRKALITQVLATISCSIS